MVKVHDLPSCSSNNAGATSSASSVVATSGICHGATVSSTAIRAQKPRTNLRATLVQQQQGPGAPPPGASAAITPHFHHVHQPWTTFAEALPPGAPPPGSGAPATFHFGPGFQPQHQHHGQHEHVVHFHVNPGVTVNFQIGESMQRISGPVTVPMVSTNPSPPIAMPVQVPPGHMVQQIVDESGTLRHVILSPQHQHQHMVPLQPPPHQHQNQPHYGPGNGSPQPHQPFFPQAMPAGYGPPPMPAYGLALAPPTHTGHSSPPPPSQQQQQHQQSHQYFKDERAQRQRIRLKRKMEMRQPRGGLVNSNAAGALNAHKELVNGLKRGMTKDQGMNSVGTSEDGEESSSVQEDEEAITEILSSVQPPRVTELTSRSALLQWLVPQRITEPLSDANEPEVPESELLYKVLLSTDRGKEGKYKSIYSGKSLSCRVEDLRPGQEYAVCVQVNWDEIHGCASEPTAFKTPACEPDQPQPPKLISRGRSSLQLRWSAAADNGSHILCYILEYDEGRGGGSFVELARGKAKQHTLQRLQTDTCYQFRLAAVNECGQSSYSSVVAFSTTGCPPPQPLPPMLREATSSSLHLHWCKRQDADDNFILQMDDKHSRHGFLPVYNGKDVEYVYRGLQRATQFWFRLQAQNEEGSSQWSEEVCYNTLPERPAKPPKPIVKGRVHSYQFRVKWDPPSDRGGADITNYMVEISTSGGVNNLLYSGPDTETMCDRLTPGTIYQVRVSCASPGGRSDWSDPCTVMTEAVCPAECGSPYLAAKPRATSIAVTWQYPQYDGGAIISDFELEITHPDGTQCIVYKGNATEFIVNNLSPGQNYVFRVRALNRVGQGPWSEVLSVTSEAAAPDAPEKPEVNAKSPFSIYVQWKEPQCHGAPVSEYRLEIGSSDRDENFSSIFQGGSTSYEVKGLTPFTSYFFRVQACNSAGCSPFSPIAVTLTPASVPSGILTPKYESTPTNVTLYWSEPQNNGAEILHYNIEIGEKLISTEEPVTEYVLENLTPDTTYKIKIQAVNIIGSGPFSSTVRVTTLPPPPPPPILECVGIGHNYLKLKWGDGKNIDFTRYCVEIDNRKLKEFQCIYQGTGYTYKVNKLQECTTYRFRVAAETDAAGPGDWSDVYEFVTSVAPPPCPKMLKTVEVTQKSCTVEWAPCRLTSTDPIFYVLQLTRVRDQDYKQVYKGQDIKYTMTELEPSAEYSVRVCAVRQAASGELPGSYVQTNFSTPTAESASNQRLTCTTPVTSSPSRGRKTQRTLVPSWFPGSHDDRPMSDKQKTLLLVILFGGFAILSGMLVESFINWRQSSV